MDNHWAAPYLEVIPLGRKNGSPTSMKPIRFMMQVSPEIREKGGNKCEDILKVIVASQPSLFLSMELPKLGQYSRVIATSREIVGQDGRCPRKLGCGGIPDCNIPVGIHVLG